MLRRRGLVSLKKRILLGAVVLLFALLQNTHGLMPTVFGARFFPLIPLCVCIGMFEGFMPGLIYGALGGAFWDVCSSGADGLHAFELALAGFVCGVLVKYIMRSKMLTAYCLTFVACVLSLSLEWLLGVYIPIGDAGLHLLLTFYLPAAVITSASAFALYYIVREINASMSEAQEASELE